MITADEIDDKSAAFEIHTSNVQRDYVFGWVLSGIYSVSELKQHFILKGGNCLRKAYFENTRFSGDLDFAVQTSLPTDFIANELNKVCDFASNSSGVIFDNSRTRVNEKGFIVDTKKLYEARLYFHDFYGEESQIVISVKMDITQFDKIYLPIQKRFLIHPYSDYQSCRVELQCIKLEEVLASKLKCLLQRRHSSDFYDYAHSIMFNHTLDIDKAQIASTFLKLTIFERTPGFARKLFVELPFEVIKQLWAKFIVVPKQGLIVFDNAVENFLRHIDEMFGALRSGSGEAYFFPPRFRNTIMEAGHSMTMLKVTYDGLERLVEPYSLAYKITKDNIGREYFYVYDRTGGSSGPGIKAFLHQKVGSITNTDEKFEPRYEVELTKAGEYSKNSYFGKPFTGRKTIKVRRTKLSVGLKIRYVYQCSVCGKKFQKTKMTGQLNQHKDKYGNRCFGRFGFYVGTKY